MIKLEMKTPLVEVTGDEMAQVLWEAVKKTLLLPFVDLALETYDLSIESRDKTDDKVTHDAAKAILRHGVGVKCATITANAARQKEFGLKALYPSPNATIRAALDGTVFRSPIIVDGLKRAIPAWKKPIVVARHAYGDVYAAAELAVKGAGKAELVFTSEDGKETRVPVASFTEAGILQAVHNKDASIKNFARSCFEYALSVKLPLLFATKDTISKIYDGRFREIFQETYETGYKDKFSAAGLAYTYTLIDDAVARVVKGEGGFVWACKNYDGDVFSDMVAEASGSLAMMQSVLLSPKGVFEYEAAHGTVQQHYYRYLRGERTSTNPSAIVFAWTGALKKRAELDAIPALIEFAAKLENALLSAIKDGHRTGDLARISEVPIDAPLDSFAFLEKVREYIR